jgi:phosphoglycerate dehydrogenase-like enzyme
MLERVRSRTQKGLKGIDAMKNVLVCMPVDSAVFQRMEAVRTVRLTVADLQDGKLPVAAEIARTTHVLLCDALPPNLEHFASLEWIQIGSVGYSHLAGLSLAERGVRVTNARGVFDVAIAEWCAAMMINLARDMPGLFQNQLERRWDRDARFQSEVRGTTLGIYGYGGIGRETARLAKTLGLQVWVLTRGPLKRRERIYQIPGTGDPEGILPDKVFDPNERLGFFGGLDYLLLSLPLTAQTEGIIGVQELSALPERAFVLNPARGPLIQERPLIDALTTGKIRGAALDTHYQYPLPPDHPFWSLRNVILTPHISGSSGNSNYLSRVWELFERNVRAFLQGQSLWNELEPQELP